MDARPLPGLEHLPYAEVWFDAAEPATLEEAWAAAAAIGKSGIEAWTTTLTPGVAPFLGTHGFEEVRRYLISELDVASAGDLEPPRHPLVTFAERPDLEPLLYELACVAYADQPGREETRIDEAWFQWGLRAHPPESYFVALEQERVLGYGYLERDNDRWRHGFAAVARGARGRGVAGSLKRAQIAFARSAGIPALRTATEVRLASMRELNRRLGYRDLYEEIVLRAKR